MNNEKPTFFDSWKGLVIKAVAIDGARSWDDIQEITGLYRNTVNRVLAELFTADAIYKTDKNEYRVSKDLYHEYVDYFKKTSNKRKKQPSAKITEKNKEKIERLVQDWQSKSNTNINLADKHFYLHKRLLDDFSKYLILHAQKEIIIVNPFIQRCDLAETLFEVKDLESIKVITRKVDKTSQHYKFLLKLSDSNVNILTNDMVHAKLIIVDRTAVIASSMNFYAASSGGKTWESGIVSISESTVTSVMESVLNLEQDYDTDDFS